MTDPLTMKSKAASIDSAVFREIVLVASQTGRVKIELSFRKTAFTNQEKNGGSGLQKETI